MVYSDKLKNLIERQIDFKNVNVKFSVEFRNSLALKVGISYNGEIVK